MQQEQQRTPENVQQQPPQQPQAKKTVGEYICQVIGVILGKFVTYFFRRVQNFRQYLTP